MTFKRLLATGLTFAMLATPSVTFAQDASSEQPAAPADGEILSPSGTAGTPEASSPEQNWVKVCGSGDKGAKTCAIYQIVATKGRQFLGQFMLVNNPSEESRLQAIAKVPLGVLLPFGMTWQIDNGKPVRVPFMLCDLRSCETNLVVNEAYVNSLKKGNKLTLTAKNRKNEDLTITINLAGFTAVYDGNVAITVEDQDKINSGEAALEQILQQRAEEAAKKLAAQESSEPSQASSEPPAAPAQ